MQIQQAIAASLLDEDSFMSELKSLEVGLTSMRKAPSAIQQESVDSIGMAMFDLPEPVRTPHMFVDDDDAIEADVKRLTPRVDDAGRAGSDIVHGPSLLWRMTAAAMFVLMMGVGAAGAAAVFHERVARIVAAWQQQ